MEWFKESRNQLKTVSRYMIQAKVCSLAKKPAYETMYSDIKEAKFSQKWVDGFMSRHNLVNRRKTTVAQRLSENYIEQQANKMIFYHMCFFVEKNINIHYL